MKIRTSVKAIRRAAGNRRVSYLMARDAEPLDLHECEHAERFRTSEEVHECLRTIADETPDLGSPEMHFGTIRRG